MVSRDCPQACRNVGRVRSVHKRESAPLQLIGRQAAPVTIGAMYFAEVADLAEDTPEGRRRPGAVVAAGVAVELAGRAECGRAALAGEHLAQREVVVVGVEAVGHLVGAGGGAHVAGHGSGGDAGGGEDGGCQGERRARVGGREVG